MEEIFKRLLNRPTDSHKYDYGHVLVIGGQPGMVGAPMMSAKAALRIGAGLVTLASTSEVIDKLEGRILELMTLRLSSSGSAELFDFIDRRKVSAIVIGPGTAPDYAEAFLEGLGKLDLPVIVDGGALGVLASRQELISPNFILTPHAGEFGHFFEESLPKEPDQLKDVAAAFARKHNVVLVQKGQPSFVYDKNGDIYQNTTGGPALASGGTGDMLTGLIAGIIAQKIESYKAAQAAVYIGGLASDMAADKLTVVSLLASDIIETIPDALKQMNQ
jgi:hydroxyethylthiazole kinase-like uncharacterized protein yjeF